MKEASGFRLAFFMEDTTTICLLLAEYADQTSSEHASALARELRDSIQQWTTESRGSSPRTRVIASPHAPPLLRRSPLRQVSVSRDTITERREYALECLDTLRSLSADPNHLQWLVYVERLLATYFGRLLAPQSPHTDIDENDAACRRRSMTPSPPPSPARRVKRARPRSYSFIR